MSVVPASHLSAFKSAGGEAAFLAAYDGAMSRWPVPYEAIDVPTRFGPTHVVVSGPRDAPPLVLLHGYQATLTMWAPNVADFARAFRVYAIDVMGQPGRSFPTDPIRTAADVVVWLTATLDGLRLGRISLIGMSYGGWVALSYAIATPARIEKLVLLSPGGIYPLTTQFKLRGMLMVLLPTRFTVNSMMRWLGFANGAGQEDSRPVLDLMYLGLKHFRISPETLRVVPAAVPDDALRGLQMPVLLLIGANETIYEPAEAVARARRLIPRVHAELIAGASHDMCVTQRGIVDLRVLEFLAQP